MNTTDLTIEFATDATPSLLMSPFETDVPVALHLDQGDSLTDLAVITNSPAYEVAGGFRRPTPFQNFGASNLNVGGNILKISTPGGRASTFVLKDQRNLMAQVNTTCEVVNKVFGSTLRLSVAHEQLLVFLKMFYAMASSWSSWPYRPGQLLRLSTSWISYHGSQVFPSRREVVAVVSN
jgi:hypothetical protein